MISYKIYKPEEIEADVLFSFIKEIDTYLTPTLSSRVNLAEYANKLSQKAYNYIARDDDKIIGISSFYFNLSPQMSYGTLLGVDKHYQKDGGIGIKLLTESIDYCKNNGSKGFGCAIRKSNKPLCKLYRILGFSIKSEETYPNSDVTELLIEKIFTD